MSSNKEFGLTFRDVAKLTFFHRVTLPLIVKFGKRSACGCRSLFGKRQLICSDHAFARSGIHSAHTKYLQEQRNREAQKEQSGISPLDSPTSDS
jgi:hypothetical protein